MIIPYAVDVPMSRWPIMNYLMIAVAAGIFVLEIVLPEEAIMPYVLKTWSLQELIGSMWLHGGPGHLIGNMIFLWVFGNAVCAKVGNYNYLLFYTIMGCIAGATHLMMNGDPMVGASGAINGVVGMYLVLYPQNDISCLYFLMCVPRTFSVSSYWMILLWLSYDIFYSLLGVDTGVAYFAHLGGIASGILIASVLVKSGKIRMEPWEKSLLEVFGWKVPPKPLEKEGEEEGWIEISPPPVRTGKPPAARNAPQPHAPPPVRNGKRSEVPATPLSTSPTPKAASPDPCLPELLDTDPPLIRFRCPCGGKIKVPAEWAGKKVRCKACGDPTLIPHM